MLAIFEGYTAVLSMLHAALLLNAAFCIAQLMVKVVATSSQGWPFGYLPGWPSRRGLVRPPSHPGSPGAFHTTPVQVYKVSTSA